MFQNGRASFLCSCRLPCTRRCAPHGADGVHTAIGSCAGAAQSIPAHTALCSRAPAYPRCTLYTCSAATCNARAIMPCRLGDVYFSPVHLPSIFGRTVLKSQASASQKQAHNCTLIYIYIEYVLWTVSPAIQDTFFRAYTSCTSSPCICYA